MGLRVILAGLAMFGLAACTSTAERTVALDSGYENSDGKSVNSNPEFNLANIGKFGQSITLVLPVDEENFRVKTGCQAGTAIVDYGPISNVVLGDIFESLFTDVNVLEVPREDLLDLLDYETMPEAWKGSDLFAIGYSVVGKDEETWDKTAECFFPFIATMSVAIYDGEFEQLAYEHSIEKRIVIDVVEMVDRAVLAGTISMGLLTPVLVPRVTGGAADEGAARIAEFMRKAATSHYNKLKNETSLPNNFARIARLRHSADANAVAGGTGGGMSGASGDASEKHDPELERTIQQIEGPYAPFMDATVVIRNGGGLGSGFLVTGSGYLVTNHHVIEGASRVTVQKRDGSITFGTVILSDATRDIAIVKIPGDNHQYLNMGHITDVQLGAPLFVIGAPERLQYTLSKGTISAIRAVNGVLNIQTDAAINGGNSGGPILSDVTGNVIAVSAWKIAREGTEGLSFGIAIDEVWTLLDESGLTLN